ncbi:NADPH-dependent F420 reductase [Xanthomonas campestris pv. campestris]|uniref:NADPH-dependent F420 reductase n=1 Tax=Xanthomonas campestris TaxID=339 RepID=UPI0025A1DBC5|nr:NAD(P)-binding domain-containing protein [Xanthomonas campestris]MDM7714392.1 NAD(P)-binding domain-containing protein [Xanthomonas campestris pv. campestris]MEB2026940.1 NAD(P)-binding domain-containing protein [Xanthomonas campestris pv. campestris]
MKIGIIGAGNIGGTLARKFVAAGHSLKLAGSKSPDSIRELAENIGAEPVAAVEAVKDVEVIVLSIPFAKIPEVAGLFSTVPAEVVVIDTSNYYPQLGTRIPEVDDGELESVWAREQLGRPIIKAFNAIIAKTLADGGKPAGTDNRIAIPVAGDSLAGKAIAQQLLDDAGFDALDAGTIADSWRQQPGMPAYCTELPLAALHSALNVAVKGDAPHLRDALMAEFFGGDIPPSHETIVARNRAVSA